jgi:methyl-accepting chemotaxis protein
MPVPKNRRRRFFINKPLQIRYMLAVSVPLIAVSFIAIFGLYIGIWGRVLSAFSNDQTRGDLLTASRMVEYEQARYPNATQGSNFSMLSLFKETEKLSQRQREIFKDILDETNKALLWKLFLLFALVSWGTIYISHKIAGPLYRLSKALDEVEKGNFRERITLRKGDEGQPVADEFNDALEFTDRLLSDVKSAACDADPGRAVSRIKEKLSTIKTSADA